MSASSKKWSGVDYAALAAGPPAVYQSADDLARGRYLASRRSHAPNQWASDHLTESQRLRGAVYLGIKTLGDQTSQAEPNVYEWHPEARLAGDQDARRALPPDHPACRIIRRPNPHQTLGMMLKCMVQQVSLTGTSLVWDVRNGLGGPKELWWVPTGTYQPVPICGEYPSGAYRIQPYYPGPLAMIPGAWPAGGVVVPADRMVAARHPHPLIHHEGLAPLSACSLAMDTIDNIDRARSASVRRGIRPSATVEIDPSVQAPDGDQLETAREEVRQLVSGPDKEGGVAMLPPGASLKPYMGGSVEIGWIQSWDQLISFTLSIFGVNKSLAFLSEDSSFAALYAALRQFNLFSLCPLLGLLSDSLNLFWLWPHFGEDVFLELTPKTIVDDEERHRAFTRRSSVGLWTINEARISEGLEPTEEAWGEERAFSGKPGVDRPAGGEAEPEAERKEPAETARARPDNPQGLGSLGNRLILNGSGRDG